MYKGLVQALRARGIDVITALDADMVARPDEAHLSYAAEQGRVLYTFNIPDFYKLHADFLAHGRKVTRGYNPGPAKAVLNR